MGMLNNKLGLNIDIKCSAPVHELNVIGGAGCEPVPEQTSAFKSTETSPTTAKVKNAKEGREAVLYKIYIKYT